MKRTKGFFRRFGISLLCAWLLMIAVSSAAFASTAQQTVAHAGPCPMLGTGSTDASAQGTVSLLQKKLQDAGENLGTFGPNHNGIDGIFGPMTHAAVISYQGKHGLGADGIVGPLTWEKLGGCWPDLAAPTVVSNSVGNPNTVHLETSSDSAKGSATFTFTGTNQLTDITMSVQDIKCDSHPVYIVLTIFDNSAKGTHLELRKDDNAGCHVTAATWHDASYTDNGGDIKGVNILVCINIQWGSDTCQISDAKDNPLVPGQ